MRRAKRGWQSPMMQHWTGSEEQDRPGHDCLPFVHQAQRPSLGAASAQVLQLRFKVPDPTHHLPLALIRRQHF